MMGKMEREGKHHRSEEAAGIIAYLLGALTEMESDHFEQRYLDSPVIFQEMQEIEDELIDDYANGALSGEDRIRFEQHFLQSPDRREKVRFAMAMTERAASLAKEGKRGTSPGRLLMPPPSVMPSAEGGQERGKLLPFHRLLRPVPAWREWAAIAAAVLLAIGAGLLFLRNREISRELSAINSEEIQLREKARSESARADQVQMELAATSERERALLAQAQKAAQTSAQPKDFTTSISDQYFQPTTMGAGEVRKKALDVPSNARLIRLTMEFPRTRFNSFAATLQRADGSSSWPLSQNLKAGSSRARQTVNVKIPSKIVLSGEYWLNISGIGPAGYRESVGSYYLKIIRR
jgi:hypothetical protein